ncbi:MAG: response regulator [Butyrivibrio sp.]|nr:response regulator [Butyrivibrio sp.]
MKTLLIADDAEVDRRILEEILRNRYNVVSVSGGKQAIQVISKNLKELAGIVMDVRMPDTSGIQVLELLQKQKISTRIPVIMVSGDASPESERICYQKGAADFIRKPYEKTVVGYRVARSLELYEKRAGLEEKIAEQTKVLRKQYLVLQKQEENLRENNNNIIDVVCAMVEFRNLESGNHLKRIKGFTQILGTTIMRNYPEYGLTPHRVEVITQASAMHDIGKITVPDAILLKPGRLTPEEFDLMKSHTTRGCELVKMLADIQDKEYYETSYDICRHHHEKYDGRGYPDGLKGEEISIAAQLVSMADIYDALVSERVYKAAIPPSKAYEMIRNGEAGIFSTKMLTSFELSRIELEDFASRTVAEDQQEDGGNPLMN